MKKITLILFLLLFGALVPKTASSQNLLYKGIFVTQFENIKSHPATADILLRYCRDSGFTSITISCASISLTTNSDSTAVIRNFIKKARTQYGIKYVAAACYDFPKLRDKAHYYNTTLVTDTLEKFNRYYFEFEYFTNNIYKAASGGVAAGTGCTGYLAPNGFTCDSVGAWNYYTKTMKSVDSLAHVDGMRSQTYIGGTSKTDAKNLWVANNCDEIFVEMYKGVVTDLYPNAVPRFYDYGMASHTVNVVALFPSILKSDPSLRPWLMSPPPTGRHSINSALPIFMNSFNNETASWKPKIKVVGSYWFKYDGNPKDSTITSLYKQPTGVTSIPASNTATLSWAAVTGATGYKVYYTTAVDYNWTVVTTTTNSLLIDALNPSTAYHFQVSTQTLTGSSICTAIYPFTTLAGGTTTCAVPGGLSSASVTNNSATLNWTAVSGAVSYAIQYRVVGTSTWTAATSTTNSKNISSLTASSNYEFQVQTICSSNSSAFSSSSTFATSAPACSVPSGLSSASVTNNSATLDWTAVSGAVSYAIQYRVVGTSTWTAATSTSNSKSISSLTASSNYEFQVQTVCSSNSSAFSSSSTFATSAPACSVPSGLSSASVTNNSATLDWTAVSGAVSYAIQYRVVGTSTWTAATSTTNSKSISSLTASSNYEFQVQTVCTSNSSAFSSSSTFATSAPACSVPSGLSSSSVTNNSATLDWTAVSGAVSYAIQYRVVGTGIWTAATSTTNSKSISSLTASSNYEFQVQTVCASNSSISSASANFSTLAPPCAEPVGLSSASITDNSATLNWTAVLGAANYSIQYRIVGTSSWTSKNSSINSKNIIGLSASSNYEFQIQTICAANSSAFSSASTFVTNAPPCVIPSGLLVVSVTASSATLSWGAVSGASIYNIFYRLGGTTTWTSGASNSTSLSISGLTPSSNYEFQVQTDCGAGNISSFSTIASFSTSNPSCNAPVNLTSSSILQTTATVQWDAVSGATSYLLQYRANGTSIWTSISSSSNTEQLTNLLPSSSYEFQVQSICSASNSSSFSSTANFTTLEPPCAFALNLTATFIGATSATLSWEAISGANSYTIHYRVVGSSAWTAVISATTSATIIGLSSSTTYEFQVQTVCSATSSSSYSASYSFVTAAASACPAPDGLFVSAIKASSAKLNWNLMDNAVSYKIQHRAVGDVIWTNNTTSSTSKTVNSLWPGITYEYHVQTVCAANALSAYSSVLTFKLLSATNSSRQSSLVTAKAIRTETGNSIQWSTSFEKDVSFYSIERSEDGVEFEPLFNIASAGNSQFQQDYEFTDAETRMLQTEGSVFYRITETDKNGSVSYLRVIEMGEKKEFEDEFKVYPNPNNGDNINLTIKLQKNEEMLVVLMDIMGKLVYSKVIVTDDNGVAATAFNPSKELAAGIYEVIGYSSTRTMSNKLIVR